MRPSNVSFTQIITHIKAKPRGGDYRGKCPLCQECHLDVSETFGPRCRTVGCKLNPESAGFEEARQQFYASIPANTKPAKIESQKRTLTTIERGWPNRWAPLSETTYATLTLNRAGSYMPSLETLRKYGFREETKRDGTVLFGYPITFNGVLEVVKYANSDRPNGKWPWKQMAPPPPHTAPSDLLVGVDQLFDSLASATEFWIGAIFATEGQWDAMCLASLGYCAVATGTAGQSTIRQDIIDKLCIARKIFLVPHHDKNDAGSAMEGLARFFPQEKVSILDLPVGCKDVCELAAKFEGRALHEQIEKMIAARRRPIAVEVPAVIDEPIDHELDDALPAFPRLPGALGQLVDGITPDLPYDHKALAAITYIGLALAGKVTLQPDHWLQPRFYSCMVGPPNSAKSPAEFEVRRALANAGVLHDMAIEVSMDSGPALVQALKETPRLMLSPDEWADQFEKCRAGATGRNSLFGELLRLYESNETGNRTKRRNGEGGKTQVDNAMLAGLGGCATNRFPDMWMGTGGNASGLQSRFTLSYSEQVQPRIKTPNNAAALEAACAELQAIVNGDDAMGGMLSSPITVLLTPAAETLLLAWRKDEDSKDVMRRVIDHMKRFAMIVAACQRAENINESTMQLALQFGDYQIALREKLLPPDASCAEQVFENLIIDYFQKAKVKGASAAKVQNRIGPERRRGGFTAYNRGWCALLRAKKLVMVGENRNGNEIYTLREYAANVQGNSSESLSVDSA